MKQSGSVRAKYAWTADGVKISAMNSSDGFEYFGNMVFAASYVGLEPESAAFPEGRITAQGGSFAPVFHLTDHLGSVRAELDPTTKDIKTENEYMPYGIRYSAKGYGEQSRYQFSGKESQTVGTLGLLDFGARMYDPTLCRWLTNDPLAEKYYSISPYVYALNNPIRFIDPDGREVFISGTDIENALKGLNNAVKKQLKLSLDENGKMSYQILYGVKKLRGDAKTLAGIIDNKDIKVNLRTTTKDETSTGHEFIGGAFMGNALSEDKQSVIAIQEINPSFLNKIDDITGNPGMMSMHEVSEAYEGGRMAIEAGKSLKNSTTDEYSYSIAHNRATPQSRITHKFIDSKGVILPNKQGAAYRVHYVTNKQEQQVEIKRVKL